MGNQRRTYHSNWSRNEAAVMCTTHRDKTESTNLHSPCQQFGVCQNSMWTKPRSEDALGSLRQDEGDEPIVLMLSKFSRNGTVGMCNTHSDRMISMVFCVGKTTSKEL